MLVNLKKKVFINTQILKRKNIQKILSKVKFIARNVVYIKNFSKKKSRLGYKNNSPIILRHLNSKLLITHSNLELRLIDGDDKLVQDAQKLRYRSFFNPKINNMMEKDEFDLISKHLVVIDRSRSDSKVVGTYRLLSGSKLKKNSNFYSSTEFNLSKLQKYRNNILEVGRSCVHENYRDGKIIKMLWKGLAREIISNNYKFIIGCASFPVIQATEIKQELSYLRYYHSPPPELDPNAISTKKVNLNLIDKKKLIIPETFRKLPPLIKGYLRAGAWIGSEAILDNKFKTIDVCVVLKSTKLKEKYLNLGKARD